MIKIIIIKFLALAFAYAVCRYIYADVKANITAIYFTEQAQENLPVLPESDDVLPESDSEEEPAGLKLAMLDLDFNTEVLIAKSRELKEAADKAKGFEEMNADVPEKLLRKIEKLRRDICNAEKKCIKAEAAMQKYM